MKRFILLTVLALLLPIQAGCLRHHARPSHTGCSCDGGGLVGGAIGGNVAQAIHETQGWRHQAPQLGPAGPPVGTVGYPYYTVRGPRDFLANDPPSIGN
jgi:hypothetical protein